MTGFKFDFNDTFEGGLADGTYEVAIQSIGENATQGGSEYIDCVLVVRNDIDQKGKNALIFHKIWKSKKDGKYNKAMLNTIGKYAQMDETKVYNNLQDVFDDLTHRVAKVTVKNETSQYNGQEYNNLNVKKWAKTDFPTIAHTFKDGTQNTKGALAGITVADEDLPF